MTEDRITQRTALRDRLLKEREAGNIVFWGLPGELMAAKLDDFIKQPVDGMLYDLNRGEEVVLTFLDDPKWVNDFAVATVIRRLVAELQARRAAETLPEGDFLDAQFRDICPNCSLTGFYRGVFDAGVRAGRAAETGMVLVPTVATPEMMEAGYRSYYETMGALGCDPELLKRFAPLYRAMLSARPTT